MSNEQAAVAALALLDAEDQGLCNQEANIAARRAEIKERANLLRGYLILEREFEKAKSKQQTDEQASTTAAASDTADGRPKYRRILEMAVDLIRAAGRPVPTGELLAQMEQRGLDVGGKGHVSALSSYLSRDEKQQVTSSKLGWKLVERGDDPPPSIRPKRQRRPRNSRRTKKAVQDQQDGMAT